jgi:hypothetical protein
LPACRLRIHRKALELGGLEKVKGDFVVVSLEEATRFGNESVAAVMNNSVTKGRYERFIVVV